MEAMLFKWDFSDETKWKDVCAELGLPEDTEQVELSVSATKVRTSQNRSWEATDEEMSRFGNASARISCAARASPEQTFAFSVAAEIPFPLFAAQRSLDSSRWMDG